MDRASKTFRIFVSSTFSDLRAERNCLQQKVFPRLREFCQQRGVHMQAIDLRWGVSIEASLDQKTMNICLNEIERCQKLTPRPNFVVLLGNRYGWGPLPPQIPDDEFDQIFPILSAEDRALICWDETDPADYTLWTQEDKNLPGGFRRKGWYRKDENAIPAQYILQPRMIEFPKGVTEEAIEWQGIEERMCCAFATAIDKLKWPANDPRGLKYLASATHQEIVTGALKVEKPEDKVFCFFREIQGAPSGSLTDTFIESDPTARVQLTKLKNKLTHLLPPSNIKKYTSVWVRNGPSQEHLNHLADDVFEVLRDAIQREIDHPTERALEAGEVHIPPDKHLDNEGLTQREFAEERVRIFVGREDALADVADYLGRDHPYPFGLSGAGGTGKSALIAKSVERALQNYPDAAVVYRFIGATPGSSNGRSLLESLCREISRRYGAEDSTIPATYRGLVPEFTRRLRLAEETRPLLVFIDALDQLSSIEDARNLKWLPANLPQHVRLVTSTRPGDTSENLKRRQAEMLELGPMSVSDGEILLGKWLGDVHRTVQTEQQKEILDKFAASGGRPLYLRFAFEEARRWASYAPPEKLAIGVKGIIRKNLLGRLAHEENHGQALISHALGYLAASRYGVAEDEMMDLLSRDVEMYSGFLKSSYHLPPDIVTQAAEYLQRGMARTEESPENWLRRVIQNGHEELLRFLEHALSAQDGARIPVVVWSRLLGDLEPYLHTRRQEGTIVLECFHRELNDVVTENYLAGSVALDRHGSLADYFRSKADPGREGNWDGNNRRALSQLPYHLTSAKRWQDLSATLLNYRFCQAKGSSLGPQPLIDDYNRALKEGPESEDLRLVRDAFRLSGHVLSRDPAQLPGQLWGRLSQDDLDTCRLLDGAVAGSTQRWLRPLIPALITPGQGLERILTGHTANITCVAVLPDARIISSSASPDNTLRIWNPDTGECLHTLKGHSDTITCIAVLADGRTVSGSDRKDSTVRVWNPDTGECYHTLKGHSDKITCIAVLADGRIVSGSSYSDCSVRVWDPDTGDCLHMLKGHSDTVNCIAILPDGRIASGSREEGIRVWDPESGVLLRTLKDARPYRLAVLPSGEIAWSGYSDYLAIWDLKADYCHRELSHNTDIRRGLIRFLSALPDGRILAGMEEHFPAGIKTTLHLWVPGRDECFRTFLGHKYSVNSAMVLPDGRIVSGSGDMTIRIWNPDSSECIHILEGHSNTVVCLAVLPDGRIVSGSADKTLMVWDPETVGEPRDYPRHRKSIKKTLVHPGNWIVSSSEDEDLRVWNAQTGECLHKLRAHDKGVRNVFLLGKGRVVSISDWISPPELKLWDPEAGRCLRKLEGHRTDISCSALLPNGWLITGSKGDNLTGGRLRVWEPKTGKCVCELWGHQRGIRCLAVLPDGRIVSGSDDKTLMIWDPNCVWNFIQRSTARGSFNNRALRILKGHKEYVRGVAVLQDNRIVSSDGDSILIWKIPLSRLAEWVRYLVAGWPGDCKYQHTLKNASMPVAVLANGWMVSGSKLRNSWDGSPLRVWDLSTGKCLLNLEGHRGKIEFLEARPSGKVVSGAADMTLRVWDPANGECLHTLENASPPFVPLPNGRILSYSPSKALQVWDVESGNLWASLNLDFPVASLAALPDGLIAAGDRRGRVLIFRQEEPNKVAANLVDNELYVIR